MRYFKGSQFVPGKGEAIMLYECDEADAVVRQCAFITGTGELTRTSDPVVKRLFRPELLIETNAAEFEAFWAGKPPV